ncbi:GntR family transcriptional regulator [Homoserinibacter sp. GY 40078]|uniref:GntR family transcriptional regulator n=1 Tax=Homoserinibacter sp. GY 40078 TaxID=2603275 RepID=UPI0011CB5936|nr:GntR family transcriptional regulator [Homoserinibacter sp. GY 40078]TXK18908.1 GntR family transcriptional regulator [Homoserinibacter sp. GY 40078]
MTSITTRTHRALEAEIAQGVFSPGARLPGERELATRYGVSRVTVRRALTALEETGVLERSPQRGWFVLPGVLGEAPSTLLSFTEMARARGVEPTAQILMQVVRTATLDEAERLRIAPASAVIEVQRVRAMDGHPVCVDLSVVAYDKAPEIAETDLTDQSIYERLETLCGIRIHRSAYSVQAVAADDDTAGLLRIAAGAPVLVGTEVAYTLEGQPVLLGVNTYRGDAYRFRADLFRPLE